MPSMTRAEMLEAMEISDADFTDYLAKFNNFFGGLNPAQQTFHLRNNKTPLGDIARSLGSTAAGSTAAAAAIQQLFDGAVQPAPAGAPPVQPANMSASISCCKNG